MKTINLKFFMAVALLLGSVAVYAQQPTLQFFRPNSQEGLSVFETGKEDTVVFEGVRVRLGGDFALQFQSLSQQRDSEADTLAELSSNFNLPSANLNIDVQLADGMRLHLRTYLSSRHHTEAYVKGGYFQIDKLDFVQPGFLSGVMNFTTLRFGMDEINYGDVHFRRSDNARAIYNPFVGNYIMDAFTTEPFAEVTVQNAGLLGVVGITNGRLNQRPTPGDDGFAMYGKLGYDNWVSDDFRFRLTGSFYHSTDGSTRDYLYGGDRAGSRYYALLDGSDFAGRFNPGFKYQTSFMINPFIRFRGLEFFGVYELANNGDADIGGGFFQIGAEALYRFGDSEQWYLGGRYNAVSGEQADNAATKDINRLNIGGGWFLTKNVLTKLEYVKQTYDGAGWDGTLYQGAQFDGIMVEAAIGF